MSNSLKSRLCLLVFVAVFRLSTAAEVSVWNVDISVGQDAVFHKTLYANTTIYMKFQGDTASCDKNLAFNISWYLRSSVCYNEVFNTPTTSKQHFTKISFLILPEPFIYFNKFCCYRQCLLYNTLNILKNSSYADIGAVAKAWEDSPYLFIVKGPHEYSSPADWPLMMFFMVMCIVYVLFGALWLMWCACYWSDLLRIQFWIGAVIILGLLEKAVFYSVYQSIRYKGDDVQGAVIFAELLSALKRSLARILVLIVSLGYGILRPRLGTKVHRLVAVGLLYLLFSSVEGILRVTESFYGNVALVANLSISLIDSCVMWNLFQTTRLLKLHENVVKLSLYQHFRNTLIFSVVASIIFIIWTTKVFKMVDCQTSWRELWVDDAFWRLLFSTILLVIMVLLRPSANRQSYVLTPQGGCFQSKKHIYNLKFKKKSEFEIKLQSSSIDEDLRWVEENIPTTVADVPQQNPAVDHSTLREQVEICVMLNTPPLQRGSRLILDQTSEKYHL
ncbi:hypothetical protein WMY93_017143 [Mugilogobius chulae]|uniref:Transmembrane protein 87A n=1 Tax=Mugilogobius chulae TaxID=88201 RepID=A0AAW0NUF4_9GOBI